MERVWYVRGVCGEGVVRKVCVCGEGVIHKGRGCGLKICLFYSSSEHTECG